MLLDRAGSDRAKVEDALRYLQAAYKPNPDDLSTGIAVSQILRSLERIAEAERVLAAMVERAPDQRALNYNYAQVLTTLGRANEAKQYLERAVAIDPTFAPAVMQLVDIYQKEGELQKAADVLQPLIAEDPMRIELQRQQAYFLPARRRRTRRARSLPHARCRRSEGHALAVLSRRGAERPRAVRRGARRSSSSSSRPTPTDFDYVASFGLSLAGQKKWDEAAQTFRKLLGDDRRAAEPRGRWRARSWRTSICRERTTTRRWRRRRRFSSSTTSRTRRPSTSPSKR